MEAEAFLLEAGAEGAQPQRAFPVVITAKKHSLASASPRSGAGLGRHGSRVAERESPAKPKPVLKTYPPDPLTSKRDGHGLLPEGLSSTEALSAGFAKLGCAEKAQHWLEAGGIWENPERCDCVMPTKSQEMVRQGMTSEVTVEDCQVPARTVWVHCCKMVNQLSVTGPKIAKSKMSKTRTRPGGQFRQLRGGRSSLGPAR